MSLTEDSKKMLSKKIETFSFIDTAIIVVGIVIIIYGLIQNELAWVPTDILLIDRVKPLKIN